jgi:hypothetical protein
MGMGMATTHLDFKNLPTFSANIVPFFVRFRIDIFISARFAGDTGLGHESQLTAK